MKKIKIKIAEDHKVVIFGLKAMLHDQERIEFCSDVFEASQLLISLTSEQTDLLILDVNIGNVNTFTLLPEIKKQFENLKIVFFTNYDTPAIRKEAFRLGAQAFVNKDATKKELTDNIFCLFENGMLPTLDSHVVDLEDKPKVLDKFLAESLLTERELEVLKLVAKGKTSQQIAGPLYISKHTVQWHRKNIIKKLDLHSASELIRFAFEHGLA